MSYDSFFKKYEKQRSRNLVSFETILERLGKRDLSSLSIDEDKINQYLIETNEVFNDIANVSEQMIRKAASANVENFVRLFIWSLYNTSLKPKVINDVILNVIYMDEVIKQTIESPNRENYPMFAQDSYMVLTKIVRDFNLYRDVIIEHRGKMLYNRLSKVYYGWFIERHMDYIKNIERELFVNRDNAVELAIRCPLVQESLMVDKVFLHKNADHLFKYLYSLAVDTVEIVEGQRMDSEDYINKVFNLFFPFHIDQLLLAVFLQSKYILNELTEPQKAVWSTVTVCALDILESWEYDEIRNLVELYGVMLSQMHESYRPRLSLQQGIAQDDYRKIIQVCDDVVADYPELQNLI